MLEVAEDDRVRITYTPPDDLESALDEAAAEDTDATEQPETDDGNP